MYSLISAFYAAERRGIDPPGIKECKKISKEPLTCKLLIKNIQPSRRSLSFSLDKSRIIDSDGNEISATLGKLGNNFGYNSVNNYTSPARNIFPYNVPVKGSVSFSKTPSKIGVIELAFLADDGGGWFTLEFRPGEANQPQ